MILVTVLLGDAELYRKIKHLFKRLGILIMRGHFALILNRTPKRESAEVNGGQDFNVK